MWPFCILHLVSLFVLVECGTKSHTAALCDKVLLWEAEEYLLQSTEGYWTYEIKEEYFSSCIKVLARAAVKLDNLVTPSVFQQHNSYFIIGETIINNECGLSKAHNSEADLMLED